MSSIYDWSSTADDNSNSDADLTWAEGQNPKTVNNSARVMMKRIRDLVTDLAGSIAATGTANGLLLFTANNFTSLANGRLVSFRAASNNTGAATLNVNGTGAKAIRIMGPAADVAIPENALVAGGVYVARYSTSANSGAGAWMLQVNVASNATWIGGAVSVANGGTGATTASAARTALGADNASNLTTGTLANARLSGAYSLDSLQLLTTGTAAAPAVKFDANTGIYSPVDDIIAFSTGGAHRMRFDTFAMNIAKTSANIATEGHTLFFDGLVQHTRDGNIIMQINRLASDGTLVEFMRNGVAQGSISVSGGVVSYNAFRGSHWAQTEAGDAPDIPRGTIVESVAKLSKWGRRDKNQHLPCFKVSDTPGSSAVYGVFDQWDADDEKTKDAYVASLGAYVIRVGALETVKIGDLIESAGNGCGRVQADDVFRASTVAKVTSTARAETYSDGSFVVPCTLHCG